MSGSSPASLPRVFSSRVLPGGALDRLNGRADLDIWTGADRPSPVELRERAAAATGLICMPTDAIDEDLLDGCPDLAVVANMAVGYDNLDVAALTRRGIPAGNTPGVLTDATADLAFALILAAARRFREGRSAIEHDEWQSWDPEFLLGLELSGATLGIVGFGRIGEAVAKRARAFNMSVIANSRHPKAAEGVRFVGLDELLAASDIVSIHVSLSEHTRHLIGEQEISLMKPSAFLVNTARGAVIDEIALLDALRGRRIAGAGLDVFEREPIGADHPLLALDNCMITPHVGSATRTTRNAMANLVVDNVLAALAGERLPACINPEVYETDGGLR